MSDTIIGVVLGWLLMTIWNLVDRRLRHDERKSERRRELYKRELKILSDSVDGLVDVIARVELSIWTKGVCQPFLKSVGEASWCRFHWDTKNSSTGIRN